MTVTIRGTLQNGQFADAKRQFKFVSYCDLHHAASGEWTTDSSTALTHQYRIGEEDPLQPLLLSFTHWYLADGCTNMNTFVCQHDTTACLPLTTEPVATVDVNSFSVYTSDLLLHSTTKNYRVFGSPATDIATTYGFATTPSIDITVPMILSCADTFFEPINVADMVTSAKSGVQVETRLGTLPLRYNAASCGLRQIDVTYTGVNPPTLISYTYDPTDGLTFTLLSSEHTDEGTNPGAVSVTVSMVDYPAVTTTFGFSIDVTPCEVVSIVDVHGGELESTRLHVYTHSKWQEMSAKMFTQVPQCMRPLSLKYYVDEVEVENPNSATAFPPLLEFISTNSTFKVITELDDESQLGGYWISAVAADGVVSSAPLKWFVDVGVNEELLALYQLMPYFIPTLPAYLNKTIGEEWVFEIPETYDVAGEETSVEVKQERKCSFITINESELFIDQEHSDETVGNCTLTFVISARGYFDDDAVRTVAYKMRLEVLPVPFVPEPVYTSNYTGNFTFNYTEEANSTNGTVINVTTIEKELEIDYDGTPPEVRKIQVNFKGNTTLFFTQEMHFPMSFKDNLHTSFEDFKEGEIDEPFLDVFL